MSESKNNENKGASTFLSSKGGILSGRRSFLAYAGVVTVGLAARPVRAEEESRIVSLKEAHKGTLEIDLRIMNQYVEQPQVELDFYTGGRTALTGPNPEEALAAHCRKFKRAKLGGPMLGDITAAGVSVWLHLPEPVSVEVKMAPKTGGASKTFTSEAARFQVVRCEGLLPGTEYRYTVTDSKDRKLGGGDFVTAPSALSEKPMKIAFGTCFHKVGLYRPELMKLVQERGSRAMLVLGDSAVDGRGNNYGLVQADYLLRNLSQPWQRLTANVPVFAIWDDHDYWGDDSGGTTTRGRSIDPVGLRKSWKTHWNNPDRQVDRKGIYFQTHIGPIHYIALDTRSCRIQEERGKRNSFLGKEQMDWLKQQIRESTSPYILLSGGTMWSDYISNGKDSWGTWDTEGREEIFQVIDAKKDTQVILLCGDRHGARGFAIPRPDGKKIYEFEVATLGGVPGPGPFGEDRSAQLFGLKSRSWAFGEFSFCTADGVPQATFRLVNERGEEVETVVLD
ncbi:alkaline phosphatase D family protein [Pontiellaceae bacterium B1224]|nr:alkaline phosphatase D family protein [Pontiellaceae bacterium B1224]